MKKLSFLLAICFLLTNAQSQNKIELAFTAENNGQYIPIDSIIVKNLTQVGDTTLYAPDTVLVLDYLSGIGNEETHEKYIFYVSQNYPNPFNGMTVFDLNLPDKEDIIITIQDVSGRKLAHYQKILNHGNHSFAFYSAKEELYILTVTGKDKLERGQI